MKFLSIFIAVSMITVIFSQVGQAAQGDIRLTPVDSSLAPSQSFDIDLYLDTGGSDIGAFNMYLDFDASDITVDTSSGDDGLSLGVDATNYSIMANPDDIANGHYRFAGICAQNCANVGEVHLLTIHLKTTAGFDSGSSNLSIRVNELANELGATISTGDLTGATITSNVVDTTEPFRSDISPNSDLVSGTTETEISLTTDENASCKYDTDAGVDYDSMSTTFTTTGSNDHSSTVTGLTDGNIYTYYVRCEDESSNTNADDTTISFTVVSDVSVPIRTSFAPTGILSSGTTQATLSMTTNENATCKYDTDAGVDYDSMATTFTTTGATVHSIMVTGLSSDTSYNYYVRCIDANNNVNTTDSAISFAVAAVSSGGGGGGGSTDTSPPVISNGTPSGNLAHGTTETTVAVQTNENSVCKYSTDVNIDYSDMPITLTTIGGTAHSITVEGLVSGSSYNYYILCRNTQGLITGEDYIVAFSILDELGNVPDPVPVPVINSVPDLVIDPVAPLQAEFKPVTLSIKDKGMYGKLKGKILLKVEDNGRAYYIHPQTESGFYLGRPRDAFNVMREQGVGITTIDLEKIPFGLDRLVGEDTDGDGLPDLFEGAIGTDKDKVDTDGDGYSDKDELASGYSPLGGGELASDEAFTGKHAGKIFLQVEGSGEAWYIHQGKRYYLGRPDGAFEIMRYLSLGISNNDFDRFSSEE